MNSKTIHAWCAPYGLCLLFYLGYTAFAALFPNGDSVIVFLGMVLLGPVLIAYYFVPSIFGLLYFLVAQSVLIAAWREEPPHRHKRIWLFAYEGVLLLYACYIIWWYFTKQQFGYL